MIKNKKRLMYIIILILVIIITITVALFVFKPFNNSNSSNSNKPSGSNTKSTPVPVVIPTQASADALKEQAAEAAKANDLSKQKTLLQEAENQYNQIGNTDAATDAAAQQYFIDHQPTQPPALGPVTVGGGGQ